MLNDDIHQMIKAYTATGELIDEFLDHIMGSSEVYSVNDICARYWGTVAIEELESLTALLVIADTSSLALEIKKVIKSEEAEVFNEKVFILVCVVESLADSFATVCPERVARIKKALSEILCEHDNP